MSGTSPIADDDNERIYVNLNGREIGIDKFEKLDIIKEPPDDFKDNLLANLYSTVEFLKLELGEKNKIINKLLSQLDVYVNIKTSSSPIKKITSHIETSFKEDLHFNVLDMYQENSQETIDDQNNVGNHSHFNDCNKTKTDDTFDNTDKNSMDSLSVSCESIIDKTTKSEEAMHTNDYSSNSVSDEELVNVKLSDQLNELRKNKHTEFQKSKVNDHSIDNEGNDYVHQWPKKTLLCVSDSIMNQLDERRLSRNMNVKVRAFSGSTIKDMYSYIDPLLKKCPDFILLHVGSNDAPYKSAEELLTELLRLKTHIENNLPGVMVILSQPIIRTDNPKAGLTLKYLCDNLNRLNVYVLDNSNISEIHLGRKGLHLNGRGTGRLALNIISMIKQL